MSRFSFLKKSNKLRFRIKALESTNARLIEEKKALEILSSTDKLTGLYNRYKFEETFVYEKRQSNRYKTELCIVMMDIDNFKLVNDVYGHNEGDIFLQTISLELKKVFRDTDVIGRWGGEEFLILLPKTSIEDAYEITQRVRKQIEEKIFEHVGSKTASFGITKIHENDTLDIAIGRADKALYDVKEHGRNQVKIAMDDLQKK
ncbi:MAG: GGDEF domain-containing protein [Sulfurimonas sp.]|nr:GGDEF domain-containing protein [Sulfurimonas sp.]